MYNFNDEITKEIYSFVLNYINEHNVSPMRKDIQENLGYNPRTITKKLEWLADHNFLIYKKGVRGILIDDNN